MQCGETSYVEGRDWGSRVPPPYSPVFLPDLLLRFRKEFQTIHSCLCQGVGRLSLDIPDGDDVEMGTSLNPTSFL